MKYRLEYDQSMGALVSHKTSIIIADGDKEARERAKTFLRENTPMAYGDDEPVALQPRRLIRIDREEEVTEISLS